MTRKAFRLQLTPEFRRRFELTQELGSGGFGHVLLGYDRELERDVAIKVLKTRVGEAPDAEARFAREARLAGSIQHPNVVRVYDFGISGQHPYIVMELVRGHDLRKLFDRGPLPVPTALSIAAGMMAGLAAAHDAGVIHRDLKPENILIDPDGLTRVTDFGIARHEAGHTLKTAHGTVLGTLPYTAPELLAGSPASRQSDLFAAAVVAYEMLSGKRPFDAQQLMLAAAVPGSSRGLPAPPMTRVPAPLAGLLASCLESDPRRRPESASAVAATLNEMLAAAPSDAHTTAGPRPASLPTARLATALGKSPPTRALEAKPHPAPRSRRRSAAAIAAGVTLLLAAFAFWPTAPRTAAVAPAAPAAAPPRGSQPIVSLGRDCVRVAWSTDAPCLGEARLRVRGEASERWVEKPATQPSRHHALRFVGLKSGAFFELAIRSGGGPWSPAVSGSTLREDRMAPGATLLAELSPGEDWLDLSASASRVALLVRTSSGRVARSLVSDDGGRSWRPVVSGSGGPMQTTSAVAVMVAGELHVFGVERGRPVHRLEREESGTLGPARELSWELPEPPAVMAAADAPGGPIAVAADSAGRLVLWQVTGDAPVARWSARLPAAGPVSLAVAARERVLHLVWAVRVGPHENLHAGRLELADGEASGRWFPLATGALIDARPRVALDPNGVAALLYHVPRNAQLPPAPGRPRDPLPEPALVYSLWRPGEPAPGIAQTVPGPHASLQPRLAAASTRDGVALLWADMDIFRPAPILIFRRDWSGAKTSWSSTKQLLRSLEGVHDMAAISRGGALHVVTRSALGGSLLYWRQPE
ncbi:MAG: serine/threonine protein kinase [Candidatus Wallbacteria bacterium]|nr:serine/threonine protein kinase [Candidatus Wallbacteria bacterium]